MNNKGLTLTEIIVSISIVSIVMVFMFQVLITVKTANDRQKAKTEAIVNTSIIMQSVQRDLKAFGLKDSNSVYDCTGSISISDANSRNQIIPNSVLNEGTDYYCIKLIFDENNVKNNEGYLFFYQKSGKGFIGYKRGKDNYMAYTNVIEIDAVPKIPESRPNIFNVAVKEGDPSFYSLNINIPIKAKDNNEYSLSVNYIHS